MARLKSLIFSMTALFVLGATPAAADSVEIALVDMLDNTQDGYCLDISGGKDVNADPAAGLQGHTCYGYLGALGVDQSFDPDKFAQGLLYMPYFDVCMTAAAPAAGSALSLSACDGSDAQLFAFEGEGQISPAAAPDLCITLAEATRSGRSSTNQIKAMTLEACAADLAPSQTWFTRVAAN